MSGMMYVLGLMLALLAGFTVTPNPHHRDKPRSRDEGDVGDAKMAYQETAGVRREGWRIYAGPVTIHLAPLVGFLVFFTIVILLLDLTYAYYIGSVRSFLSFALGASVLGLIVSLATRSSTEDMDADSIGESLKGVGSKLPIKMLPVLFIMVVVGMVVGGVAATICIIPIIIIGMMAIIYFFVRAKSSSESDDSGGGGSRLRLVDLIKNGRWMDSVRLGIAVFTLLMLLFSSFLPYVNPTSLTDNDLYASLTYNHEEGDNPVTLEDPQEVRVVSWQLATEYLQRSYGDSAAFLASGEWSLFDYTDPDYVNGRFVWVNAPSYEAWKWFGGKKVPFFVYVENDPANLTGESVQVTHKVETELAVHQTRITWANRLEQLCFDRYAAKYEIAQIRFTIDDEENPYWVVYLAERDLWFNRLHLRQILVINAEDIDDNREYDLDDPEIPSWLEVVYPDEYVYDWVAFWAENRLGIGYKWFNKAHLYEPDDVAARFIVIDGKTYWQIPLVQKTSHVLGGYVWVDTRTGDATFFNRENRSMADKDTVEAQIQKYLSSGALGYQRLDIHEGYLYPIRLTDGTVREAYIFPLYAGLTVQKYAVVDAEDYTSEPHIEDDLGVAIDRYRGRGGGGGGGDLEWQDFDIVAGYVEGEEAVISISNATLTNHTLVVDTQDLERGLVAEGENEMRELRLAIAAWSTGEPVTVRLAMEDTSVVDVDWEGADLVT